MVTDVRTVLPVQWVSSWVSCSVFSLNCQKSGVVFVVFCAEIVYVEFLYVVHMFTHYGL
jgi:hypothetical protein